MRILFVLENFYPLQGGVETLFLNLTKQLQKEGHQAVVLTGLPDESIKKKEFIEGIEIHRFKSFNRYLFTLLAIWPAYKLARKCDLIHTTSYNAGVPATIAGVLARKKTIITFHEFWGQLWHRLPFISPISALLHRGFEHLLILLRFHKYVAVSDYTKNSLQAGGVNPERLIRIYNGLDAKEWTHQTALNSSKNKDFQLLFFGRTGLSKGLDILIPSFAKVLENRNNVTLTLVLPSDENKIFQHIKEQIKHFNIENHICIKHHLPFQELQSEIRKADAVIVPSYSEGFGFSALETIYLGTPLISSGQGALKEIVSGRYIEMKNLDIENCQAAIESAIQGNWTNTPIKQFDLKTCVHNYISLYKKTLD